MGLYADYSVIKLKFKLLGGNKFLEYYQKSFPNLKLYNFGLGWLESDEYILKFRGTDGDLIVKWN